MIEPTEGESWANCPCPESGCGCEEIELLWSEVKQLLARLPFGHQVAIARHEANDGASHFLVKHPDNAWAHDELMEMRANA